MKAHEKLYGNAQQKCTKAHYVIVSLLFHCGIHERIVASVIHSRQWSK